jgi:hypothetical protein
MTNGRIRVFADSARHGYCRGCGHDVVWWDSPNGRTVALNPQSQVQQRDFSRRYYGRSVMSFLMRDLHRLHCGARARFRLRHRRSPPGQINLPVDC